MPKIKADLDRPVIRRTINIPKHTKINVIRSLDLRPQKEMSNSLYKHVSTKYIERSNLTQFTRDKKKFTQVITYRLCLTVTLPTPNSQSP